jgi:hypothetical protein
MSADARSIRSDVARIRQNLKQEQGRGNCRVERGWLYRLRSIPEGARIVYRVFSREGLWAGVAEVVASSAADRGSVCEPGATDSVSADVDGPGYRMTYSLFRILYLPQGSDPASVRVPRDVDLVHLEVGERPDEYFCHFLEHF